MPVRTTGTMSPMGMFDNLDSDIDMHAFCPNTELILSDDIWKKFELDFPEFSGCDDFFLEICLKKCERFFRPIEISEGIRNHDCMWAGHCGSKEHPTDEPRMSMSCVRTCTPGLKTPVAIKQENNNKLVSCQQSLLKPTIRNAASNIYTLQTPPMSDDEEVKPTKVLQILNQAISECDLDVDNDLREYFKAEDLDVNVTEDVIKDEPEDVKPNIRSYQYAAENDHSYHKDKNASMRIVDLGIETPSDSEEEIDVVSVGGGEILNNRMVCSLPNNPSNRDRQHIQRRMATAINRKEMPNGIKTILPPKKQAAPESSQVKRRLPESRGVKRSRQYKMTPNTPPRKKRAVCGNSSESEQEPSEKRSLHNNMERQRRIDLRNAFEDLRLLVPEVSKKERAAKVVILREAAHYCGLLGKTSNNYTRQLDELRRQQERLRGRVSQLRRTLAAKR